MTAIGNSWAPIGLATFCLLFAPLLARAQSGEAAAMAVFSSNTVRVGEAVLLEIRVLNARTTPAIQLPEIDGLELVNGPAITQSANTVNGQTTRFVSLRYTFRATRQGQAVLPELTAMVNRQRVRVPGTSLQIRPPREPFEGIIALQVEIDTEGPYYVGQTIPASLTLLMRDGLQYENWQDQPSFSSGDFQMRGPDPRQASGTRGRDTTGEYSAITWPMVLIPIKSGTLETTVDLSVVVSINSDRRSVFGQVFRDRRNAALTSNTLTIQVDSLPEPPAGFPPTGAVGRFDSSASLQPAKVQAGEPVTLTIRITGEGNFDRLIAEELEDTDEYRFYPNEVTFQPTNPFETQGTKVIQYIFVPRNEKVTTSPRIELAAFNPQSGTYDDLGAEPIQMIVTPAEDGLPLGMFDSEPSGTQRQPRRRDDLFGPMTTVATWSQPSPPLYRQPLFLAGQAIPLLFIVGLYALRRRLIGQMANRDQLQKKASSKAARAALSRASKAVAKNDAAEFYEQAHAAIAHTACRKSGQNAHALTWPEIQSILQDAGSDDALMATAESFVNQWEALRFAPGSIIDIDLKVEQSRLQKTVAELDRTLRQ